MFNIFGNAIWQLVYQSDKVTWFVLLTLLFLSIFCWTIMLYKMVIWRAKKRQIREALLQIKYAKNFEDLMQIATKYSNSIIGYFLNKNLTFLKSLLESKKNGKFEINDRDWDFLQHVANSTIDEIVLKEESYLPVLSILAAISPLLGLFGTVWGLVHAFIDISKKQSADITTVAPGIAEALITTLAGLIVAIPALVMFYNLKLKLSEIENSLVAFSDKFLFLVQDLFVTPIATTQYNFKGSTTVVEQNNAQ